MSDVQLHQSTVLSTLPYSIMSNQTVHTRPTHAHTQHKHKHTYTHMANTCTHKHKHKHKHTCKCANGCTNLPIAHPATQAHTLM